LGAGQTVENIPAVPAILDQARVAEHHQMLRDVALPKTKLRLQMTYALLAVPQDTQDGDSRRMAQRTKQVCLLFEGVAELSRQSHCIQFHEYDCRHQGGGWSVPEIMPRRLHTARIEERRGRSPFFRIRPVIVTSC